MKRWAFVVAVMIVPLLAGCGTEAATTTTAKATTTTTAVAPEPTVPDYTIAAKEDISFAKTVRFQYRVIVPGSPTEADLRAVIDAVIAEAKSGPPFNAVSVGLYASESELGGADTLGYGDLAPGGDWAAADTVKSGDYDAMELVVELN